MGIAGRPKGSKTRPQLRDFYSDEEMVDFINDLKQSAKTDPSLKKFVAEQLFGKALQPTENSFSGEVVLKFDSSFKNAVTSQTTGSSKK